MFHLPSDNTSNGIHSYQNYHHTVDNHNTETSKPPNETEATVHTQIVSHKKPHLFTIHAGPISIETNKCTHTLWIRYNFVRKEYC